MYSDYKINDTYMLSDGSIANIRNIQFKKESGKILNFGKFLKEKNCCLADDLSGRIGTMLYQANYDSKKALRIYPDCSDIPFGGTCHKDDKFVNSLLLKQNKIKLTEFPTGIVTLDNYVIGQEIPYYEDYETIKSLFERNGLSQLPTYYYLKMYMIIKELYDNGIIYSDTHGENFLIKENDIKLIDFDENEVSIDDNKKYLNDVALSHIKSMYKNLSNILAFQLNENFFKTNNIKEIGESLEEMHHELIKKR